MFDIAFLELKILVALVSLILLLVVAATGHGSYQNKREYGEATVGNRAAYIRLPLLIPFMLVSLSIMLYAPPIIYLLIGAIWGLALPVRMVVRRNLIHQAEGFEWGLLVSPITWGFALILSAVHGLFWPVSVPAGHYIGNTMGID